MCGWLYFASDRRGWQFNRFTSFNPNCTRVFFFFSHRSWFLAQVWHVKNSLIYFSAFITSTLHYFYRLSPYNLHQLGVPHDSNSSKFPLDRYIFTHFIPKSVASVQLFASGLLFQRVVPHDVLKCNLHHTFDIASCIDCGWDECFKSFC